MTSAQVFFLLSAVYMAPHLPEFGGLFIGYLTLAIGVYIFFKELK